MTGDLAVKMSAHLISESQKKGLDSAILDPKDKSITDEIIDGAKRAESYLDVPLKDRPRDPFMDSIPNHLDRPLRALIGFIDDGLPEYNKYKFWEQRKDLTLEQKIDSVISLSRQLPNQPIDMMALGKSVDHIKDDTQLPGLSLRDIAPQEQDQVLSKDPQLALKSEISKSHWNVIDKTVMKNVLDLAKFVQDGIPQGFRTEVVPEIVSDVSKLSYEILARRMLNSPTRQQPLSLDPSRLAETVLSAGVLGPDVEKIAGQFPSIFSIFSGIATVPPTMTHKFQNLLTEFQGPLSVDTLLKSLNTGKVNFIMVHEIDTDLFQETAKMSGMHDQDIAKLTQDSQSAVKNPFLSALVVKSEAYDRQKFKAKQDEVRQQIQQEVQRMNQPKSPGIPVNSNQENELNEEFDTEDENMEQSDLSDGLETIENGPISPQNEEIGPESSGWSKDSGRAGIELFKGNDLIVKEGKGFKAWKGSKNLGVFQSSEEAARAIDASA